MPHKEHASGTFQLAMEERPQISHGSPGVARIGFGFGFGLRLKGPPSPSGRRSDSFGLNLAPAPADDEVAGKVDAPASRWTGPGCSCRSCFPLDQPPSRDRETLVEVRGGVAPETEKACEGKCAGARGKSAREPRRSRRGAPLELSPAQAPDLAAEAPHCCPATGASEMESLATCGKGVP